MSDAALVARIVGGEVELYAILIARHRPRLSRYAMHALGVRADAEDVIQETFVRAYTALKDCEPERFGAWLFQILVNRCRTFVVQRIQRQKVVVVDSEIAEVDVAAPEVSNDWAEAIEAALAHLNPEQREAFLLKHVEDLSYEEMASVTGDGVSALKMRVKRACETLRSVLREVERA